MCISNSSRHPRHFARHLLHTLRYLDLPLIKAPATWLGHHTFPIGELVHPRRHSRSGRFQMTFPACSASVDTDLHALSLFPRKGWNGPQAPPAQTVASGAPFHELTGVRPRTAALNLQRFARGSVPTPESPECRELTPRPHQVGLLAIQSIFDSYGPNVETFGLHGAISNSRW